MSNIACPSDTDLFIVILVFPISAANNFRKSIPIFKVWFHHIHYFFDFMSQLFLVFFRTSPKKCLKVFLQLTLCSCSYLGFIQQLHAILTTHFLQFKIMLQCLIELFDVYHISCIYIQKTCTCNVFVIFYVQV